MKSDAAFGSEVQTSVIHFLHFHQKEKLIRMLVKLAQM
jgi:hypothetical protein